MAKAQQGTTGKPSQTETTERKLGVFDKYLTLWVLLCMVAGVLIGLYLPAIPAFLGRFEYAQVSIPVGVLIWLMIYPMMLKIDFAAIVNVGKNPKGLIVTWVVNWLIKPFTMYAISWLFFFVLFKALIPADLGEQYLAGAILLGAAPCTAMVLVWSYLVNGDAAYTLVQVATNDLIILVAFAPIVAFLMGLSNIPVPWMTIFLSVVLFIVIPLAGGWFTRVYLTKKEGKAYFENTFIPKFGNATIIGLLLTLVLIFSFQGETIVRNPLHILLMAIPFGINTYIIFGISYGWSKLWNLPFNVAAPAGMIGASNFFELAVAVAISLFGVQSGAVLATIVGVLEEVPIMLTLVAISKRTKHWFPK
jgi:ACR3 family arsenite transporter